MNLLLPVLLVFPLVGALVMYPLRGTPDVAKKVAMATALLEIVLAAVTWAAYSVPAAVAGTRFQLEFAVEWIPAFGTRFALGIDGIALVMIALTAFLVPGLMLFSWEERLPEGRTASGYFALLLATEATLMGVFTATDVFLFYVFFEVMLIPMYFLIGRFGGPRRQYAAVKFFLYSLFGGLIMLASLIGLYVVSADLRPAGGTFDWATLRTIVPLIPESTQIWLFLGFFVAFAIKAPLVPLHTWLPDAGAEAPIGAGVLLVGVLDKVGTFGFLRYCLPLFPLASQRLAPLVLILSVVGIIYGALLAVGQKDMSRFVAYTSIAHFGFIALGIFAFSTQSFAGAVLYMVNHGLSTGMLFVMVGLLAARGGSRMISDYGGVAKIAPVLAGCFLLAGLSSLALPGTNSFVSEFLVLLGSFPREPVYTIIATVGIIFAALYVLWVYQQTMQGPVRGDAVLAALGRTDSTEEEPPPVGVGFPGARRAEGGDRSGHDASDPDSDRSDHDASDPHSVRAGRPRPDQGARVGRPAGGPGAMIDPAIAARRAGSGFPDLSVREVTVLVPLIVAILLLGFFPGPVLDVINPSVAATMSEVGLTDPVGGTSR